MAPPDLPVRSEAATPEPPRPPDTKMRLRRSSSLSGQNLCPSCGTVLAEGTVLCVGCGYDLVAKRRRETVHKVGAGLAAGRFVDRVFKALLAVILVVLLVGVVAYFGEKAWSGYRSGTKASAASVPGSVPESSLCAGCRGQGNVNCGGCGGSGVAERMESKTCGQCKGSGRYALKLKKGTSVCPYCNGRGTWQEPVMRTCATCGGHRVVACGSCGGSGRVVR